MKKKVLVGLMALSAITLLPVSGTDAVRAQEIVQEETVSENAVFLESLTSDEVTVSTEPVVETNETPVPVDTDIPEADLQTSNEFSESFTIPSLGESQAEFDAKIERWEKEFKKESKFWDYGTFCEKKVGPFIYHYIPSKNGKEAWIYFIRVTNKKGHQNMNVPKKLDGKKVTRIGYDARYEKDDYYCKNVFGSIVEVMHNEDGSIDRATSKKIRNYYGDIQTIKLPSTITKIGECTFAGLRKLTTINIPYKVKELKFETFYNCRKLKNVKLPSSLKYFDPQAFRDCSSLSNVTLLDKCKTFYINGCCMQRRSDNKVVFVFSKTDPLYLPEGITDIATNACFATNVKKMILPASLKNMEMDALTNPYTMDIDVNPANPVFAKDGQTIYNKQTKDLAVAILGKEATKYDMSDQVEYMDGNDSVVGTYSEVTGVQKILFISANLKIISGYGCSVVLSDASQPESYSVDRICYKGLIPPTLEGDACCPDVAEISARNQESLNAYKKWYKDNASKSSYYGKHYWSIFQYE